MVVILIAITPYLFQLYESFPSTEVWKNDYFTITSNYYEDVRAAAWVYASKIIPLILVIIWFLTCKNWWYHIILIPIAMFSFQFYASFQRDTYIDEIEIYYVIPIMMIIIPIVYLIRAKLFDKLVNGIDLKKIEAELEEYRRKEEEQKDKSLE
ncbi:hypothetical protein IMCC3317_03710 [Kordia antarctica]|uniref:Uncharacterized protein n=1 Tax=Kordia antarctica TaxID=1218801 RepID=A0A7L4ZEG6_9FLAO|nr:hypothetical protein [Kordia antarctica]QHI35025.1 hypothetical protein IMCC3317_03710 [Kordia antarctica]